MSKKHTQHDEKYWEHRPYLVLRGTPEEIKNILKEDRAELRKGIHSDFLKRFIKDEKLNAESLKALEPYKVRLNCE